MNGGVTYEYKQIYAEIHGGRSELWEACLWIWQSADWAGAPVLQLADVGRQPDFKTVNQDGYQQRADYEWGTAEAGRAAEGLEKKIKERFS